LPLVVTPIEGTADDREPLGTRAAPRDDLLELRGAERRRLLGMLAVPAPGLEPVSRHPAAAARAGALGARPARDDRGLDGADRGDRRGAGDGRRGPARGHRPAALLRAGPGYHRVQGLQAAAPRRAGVRLATTDLVRRVHDPDPHPAGCPGDRLDPPLHRLAALNREARP